MPAPPGTDRTCPSKPCLPCHALAVPPIEPRLPCRNAHHLVAHLQAVLACRVTSGRQRLKLATPSPPAEPGPACPGRTHPRLACRVMQRLSEPRRTGPAMPYHPPAPGVDGPGLPVPACPCPSPSCLPCHLMPTHASPRRPCAEFRSLSLPGSSAVTYHSMPNHFQPRRPCHFWPVRKRRRRPAQPGRSRPRLRKPAVISSASSALSHAPSGPSMNCLPCPDSPGPVWPS